MSSSDVWYYALSDGSAVGPLSRQQLVQLLREGVVRGETLVWDGESFDWRALNKTQVPVLSSHAAGDAVAYAAASLPKTSAAEVVVTSSAPKTSASKGANKAPVSDKQQRRDAVERSRAERKAEREHKRSASNPPPRPSAASNARVDLAEQKRSEAIKKVSSDRVGLAFRRWCARIIDSAFAGLLALAIVLLIALRAAPELATWILTELNNPLLVVCAGVIAWIPFEALALAFFGTTPGKWLWGIQIDGMRGQSLGIGAAMQRSMTVAFRGMFFGLPPIALFLQAWAFVSYVNQGHTSWDLASGTQLQFRPLNGNQTLGGLALLVVAVLGAASGTTWSALLEAVFRLAG